ncbi:MAG: hypothetical protein ACP5J4_15220 [Anaerolineae bacterium]
MHLILGNLSITIKSGALIPLLIMLPNVVWMAMPKAEAGPPVSEPLWLTILENVGRLATLVLPFFFFVGLAQAILDAGDDRHGAGAGRLLRLLDQILRGRAGRCPTRRAFPGDSRANGGSAHRAFHPFVLFDEFLVDVRRCTAVRRCPHLDFGVDTLRYVM